MTERAARAALAAAVEPGSVLVGRLVAACGPQDILAALCSGRAGKADVDGRIRRRLSAIDGDRVLAAGETVGARFVCPGDPEWPPALAQLDLTLDGAQRAVPPPFGLWVRGRADLAGLAERSVAIVGARAATAYGTTLSTDIAAEMAIAGWTVVSGAAYGIDGAAHRGALAMNQPTVAVLACGVDIAYPRAHTSLLDRIVADGLIVSERPPGAVPTRPGFLKRNRIIAALTCGTVIVEAALRSGALSTARWAADIGRLVAAVPGPASSSMSSGCHSLIREGAAVLVTSAAEVADAVGAMGVDAVEEPRGPDRVFDALTPTERDVFEAIPGQGTMSVDAICAETGLSVPACMAALTSLAAAELVAAADGDWRLQYDAWRAGA